MTSLVGSTSESMLSAAQTMTSSLASTSAVSSASQFSAETYGRKAKYLSIVEVISETQDSFQD